METKRIESLQDIEQIILNHNLEGGDNPLIIGRYRIESRAYHARYGTLVSGLDLATDTEVKRAKLKDLDWSELI